MVNDWLMLANLHIAINLPFTKGMVWGPQEGCRGPDLVNSLLVFGAANTAAGVNHSGKLR